MKHNDYVRQLYIMLTIYVVLMICVLFALGVCMGNILYEYSVRYITVETTEQTVDVPEQSGTSALVEPEYEPITLSSRSMVEQPWWTERELDLLAAVIYYEAGSNDCSDRHQQLVGQVVLNRVASHEFPNTIYDVITQTKPTIQYSTYKRVLAANPDEIPDRCYSNALAVLRGEVDCPDNIVWQANFRQGSGVYEEHKTSYSTSYFCYR